MRARSRGDVARRSRQAELGAPGRLIACPLNSPTKKTHSRYATSRIIGRISPFRQRQKPNKPRSVKSEFVWGISAGARAPARRRGTAFEPCEPPGLHTELISLHQRRKTRGQVGEMVSPACPQVVPARRPEPLAPRHFSASPALSVVECRCRCFYRTAFNTEDTGCTEIRPIQSRERLPPARLPNGARSRPVSPCGRRDRAGRRQRRRRSPARRPCCPTAMARSPRSSASRPTASRRAPRAARP